MTWEQRLEFLNQSIESHDRQLGEITDKLSDLTGMVGQLAGAMKTLAETVTAHERRITGLEGAA